MRRATRPAICTTPKEPARRRDDDPVALVVLAGFIQIGAEEKPGAVGDPHHPPLHGRAIDVTVEHRHENRNARQRLRAQSEIGGRDGVAFEADAAVGRGHHEIGADRRHPRRDLGRSRRTRASRSRPANPAAPTASPEPASPRRSRRRRHSPGDESARLTPNGLKNRHPWCSGRRGRSCGAKASKVTQSARLARSPPDPLLPWRRGATPPRRRRPRADGSRGPRRDRPARAVPHACRVPR